jgi:serine/threonine-protein kinase RsbW
MLALAMKARGAEASVRAVAAIPRERVLGAWPAEPASVSQARRAVVDHATALGATAAALAAIELAVSEAVTNAVQHAYAGAPESGPVKISAAPADGALVVVVADEGTGMRPRPDSPGLGLGLPLISQMTQSFEVHQPPRGGTVLSMRFDLTRGLL